MKCARALLYSIIVFSGLANKARGQDAMIEVHAGHILHPISRFLTGACIEDVNHEIYGGLYSQMIFGESFQEPPKGKVVANQGVSGMWGPIHSGTAEGRFSLETDGPFLGSQSQRITFDGGAGEIGLENRGLNRWGMCFVKGKPYQGYFWARADKPVKVLVTLESADGAEDYAAKAIAVSAKEWRRFDFTLTPVKTDKSGRFALKLERPGSVLLGHAFLQPGEWGRFKGLPVRKDVAEALVAEGITVLRYGGSMVNDKDYRWENMIGARDRRPSYRGTWYPYSSNGWSIFDFLEFCEAAGFLGIPDLNMDESPSRMAEFVQYANGPVQSEWGRRRAGDGHRAPFGLTHIELGNEEKVDEHYWHKFKPMAEAIWAEDPNVILVVGDFFYGEAIKDPFQFKGGSVATLAIHKKILDLAREHGREVWFDIHINTEQPPEPGDLAGPRSFIEQLGNISPGAKFKACIFEFNANNHAVKRALANACALEQVEQMDERLAVACSANCLQPDGQNDNGWDQGLLFLNPSQVWLQPPGIVSKMISRNYEPLLVQSECRAAEHNLNVTATRSQDGKTLVLQVVNIGSHATGAAIRLDGLNPVSPFSKVEQLAGPLDEVNTKDAPDRVKLVTTQWRHHFEKGDANYVFPAHSFSVVRIE